MRKLERTMAYALVAAVTIGLAGCGSREINGTEAGSSATYSFGTEFTSEMISNNYTKVSAGYSAGNYKGEDVTVSIPEDDYALCLGSRLDISVNVPETAKYDIVFTYESYDESVMPVKLAMKIDDEFPFYECRNITLETTWVSPDEKSYDRYGNEIIKVPEKLVRWETKKLGDGAYRYSRPLAVELEKGVHTFSIEVNEGTFYLARIALTAPEEIPAYAGAKEAEGDELIIIEAEDFLYRNDSSVHAVAEFDTAVTPYEVEDKVLNTVDSASFKDAGQTVTYEFTVKPGKAGFYNIGMNYRQSDKEDFPVFLNVAIDGEIPNTAFMNRPMEYTNRYKNEILTDDDGNSLSVYLDEGVHTVSFTISNDVTRHILEGLDEAMSAINDLSLEITKVAGTNSSKYRDLKLSRYIPTITEDLRAYAENLYALQASVQKYSAKKTVPILSTMSIAAETLLSLAEEPDEIPYRIAELSSGSSSVTRQLANAVDNLLGNNIAIDRIYICGGDAKLPKGKNIFVSAWLNLRRFVASFTNREYSSGNVDKEHIQVWVNRSSQYIQIMQKMVDEEFTKKTGIQVDISVMSDQYKLVLATTGGNQPDVATGINYTVPYELAIRGALADMTAFPDFKEVASVYEPGLFMTGTINDSVYSMPETMNFWVLFYRSDILSKIGIEIPDTMQDVIDMLPELQMRGLNYYQPVSGMIAMRNFHGTSPLIAQHGGSLYYDTAQEGTAFGSPESVEGFTYLCELFTIYDLPINIDNFYQHLRNGDMPIGVADYGTYNLMKNAAPELADSWEIGLVPGIAQEDGSVSRTICGNAESCVIFKSDAEREAKAWEFIKWWSSTDVQAEFGQTLQITYGDEYMWTSANLEAFDRLPWDSKDKKIIEEQMKQVCDMVRVPGTYLLEREVSNAFNDIVVNGDTARMRIDEAVKTINREIDRKLEEFGFIDGEGNTLREYRIPTLESIKKILGRNE